MQTQTTPILNQDRFEAWLLALDDLCFDEMGVSYQDLPDQCLFDWFRDNLSPEDACYQLMQESYPGIDTTFTQEFDTFTDATPGL